MRGNGRIDAALRDGVARQDAVVLSIAPGAVTPRDAFLPDGVMTDADFAVDHQVH